MKWKMRKQHFNGKAEYTIKFETNGGVKVLKLDVDRRGYFQTEAPVDIPLGLYADAIGA